MHTETLGPEPAPPLFDLTALTADQLAAYADLLAAGGHVVLCASSKTPLWTGWNQLMPAYEDVWHHDGPVGIIPASRDLVVFDIDTGTPDDIDAFAREYPPIARLPSRQAGRWHFCYPTASLVKNSVFRWRSVAGDVRSHAGYVVLWGDNATALRNALLNLKHEPAPAPLHLIQKTERPAPARHHVPPVPDFPGIGNLKGSPGPTLFEALRQRAYRIRRGTNRTAWGLTVLAEAERLNREQAIGATPDQVASTAEGVTEWVWSHFTREYTGGQIRESSSEQGRRMGLASGISRRRGTPLEHDRTPWITEGVSRSTWMRRQAKAKTTSTHAVPKSPDPHLALGISRNTWDKRLSRARAGTYRGAKRGVPPWEPLGISEAEWRQHYAPGAPVKHLPAVDNPSQGTCQKNDTELNCSGGEGREGGVGQVPVEEPVKGCRPGATPGTKPGKSRGRTTDPQRQKAKQAIRNREREAIVDAYLAFREPGYALELRCRGVRPHGLRRPAEPFPDYDPTNPQHRRKMAISMSEKARHDLDIAKQLYAAERRLGLVVEDPPWLAARDDGYPEDPLVDWYLHDRADFLDELRLACRMDIADRYSIPQAVLLPRDEPTRYCLAPYCGGLAAEDDVLCPKCRRKAEKMAQCPTCGESVLQLLLEHQPECAPCTLATPDERAVRASTPAAEWQRFLAAAADTPVVRPLWERLPGVA